MLDVFGFTRGVRFLPATRWQYPGNFELKIIGLNEAGFVSDMRRAVAGCLTKGDENVVSCTTREKGRYTSITLKVFVENSAQLYKVTAFMPQVMIAMPSCENRADRASLAV